MNAKAQPEPRPIGRARPLTRVDRQTQLYGEIAPYAIGLSDAVCAVSVRNLNQLLADTMTLRDLYKKHHWQVSGTTSIRCIFCTTSTTASRRRSSTSWPSGCRCSVG
jgi:hypothetical protein